jgi:hypothetical protein
LPTWPLLNSPREVKAEPPRAQLAEAGVLTNASAAVAATIAIARAIVRERGCATTETDAESAAWERSERMFTGVSFFNDLLQ